MIRLHFVVEGDAELAFVRRELAEHLGRRNIVADARKVETSRTLTKKFSGGVLSYQQVKKDLTQWMSEDDHRECYFTTMLDLYALPDDFPEYEKARKLASSKDRVVTIEESFRQDIDHHRFIPYVQLHEFEALLLSQPIALGPSFGNSDSGVAHLEELVARYPTPECIDDGSETAPSKRIIQCFPAYKKLKSSAGPIVASRIGIKTIREKCPHFDQWLTKLEGLPL